MIQVFLQNAWSPLYAGDRWPRASWLRALKRSRSGKRLQILTGDLRVRFENTTWRVSPTQSGKFPPCRAYISDAIGLPVRDAGEDEEMSWQPRLAEWHRRFGRKVIVACGQQAEGPLVIVPHPAARVLTDALYRRGNEILNTGLGCQMALRQRRGSVEEVEL